MTADGYNASYDAFVAAHSKEYEVAYPTVHTGTSPNAKYATMLMPV